MSYCAICGGERKVGKTTYTTDFGFGVLVVRDVPAHVCSQCGEEWIEDSVAKELEVVVEEARKEHRQVEVLSLSKI